MFFARSRRRNGAHAASSPRSIEVKPWRGDALVAEWAMLPLGTRNRSVPSVVLTSGEVSTHLHAAEALMLVEHKIGIAESIDEPKAFFCWSGATSPSLSAAELVKDLPGDSLALLVEPMDTGLTAVVTGDELKCFTSWVFALPF